MADSTEALVIKSVKFSETSLILHLFTHKFGLVPIMLKGVRKSKKGQANIVNPGSYLQCTIDYQNQRNFQYLKDYKPAKVFWNIIGQIPKNCILIFCIEILQEILVEGDEQSDLFDFSINFFKYLDQIEDDKIANLPFYFLGKICFFLGYQIPLDYHPVDRPYFNIHQASFESSPSVMAPILQEEESHLLFQLLNANLEDIHQIKIKGITRQILQDTLIDYLRIHTPYFRKIKSLEVLRAILS